LKEQPGKASKHLLNTEKSVQAPGRRRLQREKDFTGERLVHFRQVFLRHGLPGLVLALALVAIPGFPTLFLEGIGRGLSNPIGYATLFFLIFLVLGAYAGWSDRQWSLSRLGWVIYLGALSLWEEWVFRLAIPTLLEESGASVWQASILSALVFGGVHYFTLRWRLRWCIGAFLGGLLLSRQMQVHDDLLLVAAFHWIATLVNTPRPPQGASA